MEPARDSDSYDKLYKVRPIVEQLNHLFPKYYRFTSHMAIDESSVRTKSKDAMRMFMANKPCHFWFPYMVSLLQYQPTETLPVSIQTIFGQKYTKVSEHGLFFDVVNRLTQSIGGSNTTIFTDSTYMSCKVLCFFTSITY